jgi:hypothetical protein
MKRITRERPKIDRIACPWLVARFIDPEARFLYVPPGDVLRIAREQAAIPCDIPGVEVSHVGKGETHNRPPRMQAMRERWPAGRREMK